MTWFDRNLVWIAVGLVFAFLILFNIYFNTSVGDTLECIEENPKVEVIDVVDFSTGGFGGKSIYKYQTEQGPVMSYQRVDIGENVTMGCYP